MSLKLKPFSPLDGKKEWELIQKIGEGENGFMNDGFGIPFESFDGYILKNVEMSNGINLKSHLVPQTSYWLTDGETLMGYGKIRHYLNEALLKKGGHIGYCVAPEFRGEGYGKELLKLLLERARYKGIDSALITCSSGNISSQRVIQANGGILQKADENDHWYWVHL
ncbi:GNAT family N-acetyltransferase [Spirochaeta isovalerica]|uniref:Putative acetyltransferase n=1 Tax=Spirochaeta isovalerica TaxID=150 RepID=A0A841RIB9_9SPIO|nr:GNAT family N-acetyltransferase [Spirochaeta isovalerica]MBB6482278.1 putative acetyltransferase [Spirochaeta isovalerica]